jgi:hypothetical protein
VYSNFICLTLGPVFIAAAAYLSFTRYIQKLGPQHARLRPMTYTITFVCIDCICLVVQATGGGIAVTAQTQHVVDIGTIIMLSGLSFQCLSLMVFIGVMIDFRLRCKRARHQLGDSFSGETISEKGKLLRSLKSPSIGKRSIGCLC